MGVLTALKKAWVACDCSGVWCTGLANATVRVRRLCGGVEWGG